jgi:hypothetical protein
VAGVGTKIRFAAREQLRSRGSLRSLRRSLPPRPEGRRCGRTQRERAEVRSALASSFLCRRGIACRSTHQDIQEKKRFLLRAEVRGARCARELFLVQARIACRSMHQDIPERKRWLGARTFSETAHPESHGILQSIESMRFSGERLARPLFYQFSLHSARKYNAGTAKTCLAPRIFKQKWSPTGVLRLDRLSKTFLLPLANKSFCY